VKAAATLGRVYRAGPPGWLLGPAWAVLTAASVYAVRDLLAVLQR
jgi:hypothetical protein